MISFMGAFKGSRKGEAYIFSTCITFCAYLLAVIYKDTNNFAHFALYMTVAAPAYVLGQSWIDKTKAEQEKNETS